MLLSAAPLNLEYKSDGDLLRSYGFHLPYTCTLKCLWFSGIPEEKWLISILCPQVFVFICMSKLLKLEGFSCFIGIHVPYTSTPHSIPRTRCSPRNWQKCKPQSCQIKYICQRSSESICKLNLMNFIRKRIPPNWGQAYSRWHRWFSKWQIGNRTQIMSKYVNRNQNFSNR